MRIFKKGIDRFFPSIQMMVIVSILIGIGIIVFGGFQDQINTSNVASDPLEDSMLSVSKTIEDFASWLPILVIGMVALVVTSLMRGGSYDDGDDESDEQTQRIKINNNLERQLELTRDIQEKEKKKGSFDLRKDFIKREAENIIKKIKGRI